MSDLPGARIVRGGAAGRAGGGAPSAPVLRLAPREVPWRLVWRIWFGAPLAWCGWLFAAVGMVACVIFLPLSEAWAPGYDRTTVATVTSVEATRSSENDETIYRVRYTFVDERGVTRTGASYTTRSSLPDEHRVEYVAADPDASRLVGMRSRPFGAIVLLVLIFPVVGLGMALHQLVVGWRATRLLRRGVETRGRLVGKRPTSVRVDNQPVMALTFAYEVGGRTHHAVIKTTATAALEDDAEEPMVYDPLAPSRATTLDHLPGTPRITPTGDLDARPGSAVLVLVPPAVTVALLAVTIVLLAAR